MKKTAIKTFVIMAIPILTLILTISIGKKSDVATSAVARKISESSSEDGFVFNCSEDEIVKLKSEMSNYLRELRIDPSLIIVNSFNDGTKLGFTLNTPADDTNTLDLGSREELQIVDEIIELPTKNKKPRKVTTVSKKEIALALFQHGRLTEFKGEGCNIQAFKDHSGIRQNTVAWTEELNWDFPDGKSTGWNPKFWDDSPMPTHGPLHFAINDLFMNQRLYSMGCYSASKSVNAQGVLDYYSRVRPDPKKLILIEKILEADGSPLSDLEPGTAWDFLKSTTPEELKIPGKILTVAKGVAKKNFVPGDWVYIKNTDKHSSKKPGYEGSNALYLGRNNFDDYYNEIKSRHYTFVEKINEVYQWRNGVFTSSESSEKKKKKLTDDEFDQLLENPKNGGILVDHRIGPKVL